MLSHMDETHHIVKFETTKDELVEEKSVGTLTKKEVSKIYYYLYNKCDKRHVFWYNVFV